jgi:uncharacterized RDD family membrane protein YckC
MTPIPTPHLPGSRPGTVYVPQGPLLRGPAFLLDTFVVSLPVALAFSRQGQLMALVLVTLAAEFAYFAICEGVFGTTLGKRLFGLRVIRADDGRPCGPFAALIRTAMRLVDNILFSLPGITAIVTSPRRQRFGDRAARTLVVSEVPEQLLKMFGALPGQGTMDAADVAKSLNELAQRQRTALEDKPVSGTVQPDGSFTLSPSPSSQQELVPCPFCDQPMVEDEIVCRHCDHYVNQTSAHGETEALAPLPQLYSEDRNYRFDAIWRLVFAGDHASLDAVKGAVPTWPPADRLLAVHMFSEVDDARPLAFLEFMTRDRDPAVEALARHVRRRLSMHA